ncbi:MAG: C25 family cysteine peptidase, partial [Candidatus Syntrophosphaera sp.]
TWADSVGVIARVFTNENVVSFDCHYTTNIDATSVNWITLPMEPHPQIDNAYVTTQRIPPQSTGQEVTYKYVVTTENETYESFLNNHVTRGPDLLLGDIRLETSDSGQNLEVFVRNIGDAASIPTDLRLYVRPAGGAQTLFSTQDIASLGIDEERWETIPLEGLEPGEITFEVRVNWTLAFPEWDYSTSANNIITLVSDFNYYSVGSTGDIISSIDENLSCEIPQGLVPDGQESIFYVNGMGELSANNQPDIFPIKLLSYDTDPSSIPSNAYEIGTLNPALVDTTDTLINNIRFKLTFYYSVDDDETQALEAENSYKIYRWDASGSKWILQGGNISATQDKVVFEVSRQGIYTIYRNTDRIRPSIDMNVQDQEFTVGGYISGTGTISLVLSDANGIDVFDNTIRLYLNGSQIPETDYVTSINSDNVNRIPIKYQIELG